MKRNIWKPVALVVGSLLGLCALTVGGYVIYLQTNYYRIADHTALEVENQQAATVRRGQDYTAVTNNLGFGAYDQAFSFFMDTGMLPDGTATRGQHARAQSHQAVLRNTAAATEALETLDADFYLLQEVDRKATRSYGVDQAVLVRQALPDWAAVYASNFHSVYLAYPLHEPHGSVEAGLLTLSRYHVAEAVRRSYPVDASFVQKFFDLDRCFSVQRLPVDGGGELVLINTHMSAYDEGGVYRDQQMQLLCDVLAQEAAQGNYVIVGGDFNQLLLQPTEPEKLRGQDWVVEFDAGRLPAGFSVAQAENGSQVDTCRAADMPYDPEVTATMVIDGFLVSDNVAATARHVDTDFVYSDHNPVLLSFTLE